jgi:hypothetical protein
MISTLRTSTNNDYDTVLTAPTEICPPPVDNKADGVAASLRSENRELYKKFVQYDSENIKLNSRGISMAPKTPGQILNERRLAAIFLVMQHNNRKLAELDSL